MISIPSVPIARWSAALLTAGALAAQPLVAQNAPTAAGGPSVGEADEAGRRGLRERIVGVFRRERSEIAPASTVTVQPGRRYVLVDTDANEVRLMDGDEVIWSAPAGTGTGMRLKSKEGDWEFGTPAGVYQVQHKELNPVWIAPDWYFVEHKLPLPPQDAPERRQPGGLGAAAVYLGAELAIHGTDKPELLGQRVSHGCIRLSDEFALRLFHSVQIGTPVVIRGSAREPALMDTKAPVIARGTKKKQVRLRSLTGTGSTAALVARLDSLVATNRRRGWTETASLLVERALAGNDSAADALVRRIGRTNDARFELEYAAFVADAHSRRPRVVLSALGRTDEAQRSRAAAAIVDATLDLYHGTDPGRAPWPTSRIPKLLVVGDGQRGWDALKVAEEALGGGPQAAP